MKSFKILLKYILCTLFLTACQNEEPIVINYPIPDPTIELMSVYIGNSESGDNDTPSLPLTPPSGEGTKDSPYNCTAVINLNNPGTSAWVKGYIVGYYDYNNNSSFVNSANGAVPSHIVIADDPSETDITKTVAVQLIAGTAIREALNLQSYPENLGKELAICGNLTAYSGRPGVKDPTDFFFFKESNSGDRDTKPYYVIDKNRVNSPEFIYDNDNKSKIFINIITNDPLEDGIWDDVRLPDWELQEKPSLIDLTTDSELDINYLCDNNTPNYDLCCGIWTEKGIYFLPGHTYEVSINVATNTHIYMKEDIYKELYHKYGLWLRLRDMTATYSKKLTFTVPTEEN